MLVLPEVSIPYSWLPFMAGHARSSQIALVFGMEHWVNSDTAYNLLVTILPYRDSAGYRAAHIFVRPKNYYSPEEKRYLEEAGLKHPDLSLQYDIFDWRGARFSVFNCFELTNIKHRAMLRAAVEFLVAVEWNKDTRYFSNIVESTVRDLHCHVVQVNASQYGDSRVTSPKSSRVMNVARVSGGSNTTLLKAIIGIKEIIESQKVPDSPTNGYKPPPAGFEHDDVRRWDPFWF